MSTMTNGLVQAESQHETPPDARAPRRGLRFWIVRYLPAEVVGTVAMMTAGALITLWTDNPALIALAAVVGESVGFYAVLVVSTFVEQSRVDGRRSPAVRTGLLLVAEFGPAELVDTLLIRPAALYLGVLLIPDPVWGLLVGKVAADMVFYAIAAGAFTLTARAGLRDAHLRRERAS